MPSSVFHVKDRRRAGRRPARISGPSLAPIRPGSGFGVFVMWTVLLSECPRRQAEAYFCAGGRGNPLSVSQGPVSATAGEAQHHIICISFRAGWLAAVL